MFCCMPALTSQNMMGQPRVRIRILCNIRCPKFLFSAPLTVNWPNMRKRDALCIEHLAMMNTAFCEFYHRIGCVQVAEE